MLLCALVATLSAAGVAGERAGAPRRPWQSATSFFAGEQRPPPAAQRRFDARERGGGCLARVRTRASVRPPPLLTPACPTVTPSCPGRKRDDELTKAAFNGRHVLLFVTDQVRGVRATSSCVRAPPAPPPVALHRRPLRRRSLSCRSEPQPPCALVAAAGARDPALPARLGCAAAAAPAGWPVVQRWCAAPSMPPAP